MLVFRGGELEIDMSLWKSMIDGKMYFPTEIVRFLGDMLIFGGVNNRAKGLRNLFFNSLRVWDVVGSFLGLGVCI